MPPARENGSNLKVYAWEVPRSAAASRSCTESQERLGKKTVPPPEREHLGGTRDQLGECVRRVRLRLTQRHIAKPVPTHHIPPEQHHRLQPTHAVSTTASTRTASG